MRKKVKSGKWEEYKIVPEWWDRFIPFFLKGYRVHVMYGIGKNENYRFKTIETRDIFINYICRKYPHNIVTSSDQCGEYTVVHIL